MKASVILPVYGQYGLTHYFCRSFRGLRLEDHAELLVMDDDPNSKLDLDLAPNMRYYRNTKNLGFGGNCNAGANLASNDILIFINNDVTIYGDFVSPLIRQVVSDQDAIYGPQVIDYPAGWNEFSETLVTYVAGWCFGLHSSLWRELGGFDPAYGKYDFEDVDLCYRAGQEGHGLRQITLPIRHMGARTIQYSREREAQTRKNREVFARKWGLTPT